MQRPPSTTPHRSPGNSSQSASRRLSSCILRSSGRSSSPRHRVSCNSDKDNNFYPSPTANTVIRLSSTLLHTTITPSGPAPRPSIHSGSPVQGRRIPRHSGRPGRPAKLPRHRRHPQDTASRTASGRTPRRTGLYRQPGTAPDSTRSDKHTWLAHPLISQQNSRFAGHPSVRTARHHGHGGSGSTPAPTPSPAAARSGREPITAGHGLRHPITGGPPSTVALSMCTLFTDSAHQHSVSANNH